MYSANNRSPIASNATRPVLNNKIVYLGNEDDHDGLVVVGVDGHNGHSGSGGLLGVGLLVVLGGEEHHFLFFIIQPDFLTRFPRSK